MCCLMLAKVDILVIIYSPCIVVDLVVVLQKNIFVSWFFKFIISHKSNSEFFIVDKIYFLL